MLKLAGLIPCYFLLLGKKELYSEYQLGPSLACQPKAPTSECLLPSFSIKMNDTLSYMGFTRKYKV